MQYTDSSFEQEQFKFINLNEGLAGNVNEASEARNFDGQLQSSSPDNPYQESNQYTMFTLPQGSQQPTDTENDELYAKIHKIKSLPQVVPNSSRQAPI